MPKITYDSALADLRASKATIKCNELIKYLEALGYEVNKAKSGNHHTFTHPGLQYYGGNFDCGHGKNPTILPVYVGKIIRILSKHNDDVKDAVDHEGKSNE